MMPGRTFGASALLFRSRLCPDCFRADGAANRATHRFPAQVRPILSENCFQCHGPDKGTRMADLRLDTREGAFREARRTARRSCPAIRGQPALSAHQPPRRPRSACRRRSRTRLSPSAEGVLAAGSSRARPGRSTGRSRRPCVPALPAVKAAGMGRAIRSTRSSWRSWKPAGLQPAAEADRRTLIRRVSLDLTGLPPDAGRSRSFRRRQIRRRLREAGGPPARLAALWRAPRALLAGRGALRRHARHPHRQLSRDVALSRLGDRGLQPQYAVRPFTIEQLAGDLLPNPTLDQQIATGFQRCNVTTNEGGIIAEEVAAMYAKDRVETTGAVWLGLTVGCATCHDHKFDPIAQKEFYQFARVLPEHDAEARWTATFPDTPPVVLVPRAGRPRRGSRLTARLAAVRKARWPAPDEAADGRSSAGSRARGRRHSPLDASDAASSRSAQPLEDARRTRASRRSRDGVTFRKGRRRAHRQGSEAGSPEKPFSIASVSCYPKGSRITSSPPSRTRSETNRGWVVDITARLIGCRLIGDDGGKPSSSRAADPALLRPGTWNHVAVTYDGSRQSVRPEALSQRPRYAAAGRGTRRNCTARSISKIRCVLGQSLAEGAIADFRLFRRVRDGERGRFLLSGWPPGAPPGQGPPQLHRCRTREACSTWYPSRDYANRIANWPMSRSG